MTADESPEPEIRLILKFELHVTDGGQHAMPAGSFFLDLQLQNGRPVMWWSVPANKPAEQLRTFRIAPTGRPGYTRNLHYVGTFQVGGFVGHVLSYEPVPRSPEEARR